MSWENKSAWQSSLKSTPLKLNPEKTIFLSPHPDDETLGCGGLIADLAKLHWDLKIISITNGEAAYPNISDLAKIRIVELKKSIKILGLSEKNLIGLNLKDGKICEDSACLETSLIQYLSPNCNLFAPWRKDYHPDHEIVGKIATKLANQLNIKLFYYFIWSWHFLEKAKISNLKMKKYFLHQNTFKIKMRAITCYQSQLQRSNGNPILTDSILKPFKRNFEVFSPYEKSP